MPTISQLPVTTFVSSADEVLISQGGKAQAVSVGDLLASTQPSIITNSSSLIGRKSVGAGGPEEIDVGIGINLTNGTLVADGLDHASFPVLSTLGSGSDLVISNEGSPMLMQASALRGLFSAGPNVAIDSNGTISSSGPGSVAPINELPVVSGLASMDLVAVSQSGSDCAIAFSNFLSGVTIDQAQPAGAVGDSDLLWAAQGGNIMASQTFGAIWTWIFGKLPLYRKPVVEILVNTSLDGNTHNSRTLICSQAITLGASISAMGSGFQCVVINASTGNVTLGSEFVTSSGSFALTPWQSASISCASYSGGTIAFASMPGTTTITTTPTATAAIPSQISGVLVSNIATTTASVAWQVPVGGGTPSSYIVQYRVTGTTFWISSLAIEGQTAYQLTGLQTGTGYDVIATGQNGAGLGGSSTVLTFTTSSVIAAGAPGQVTGLTATPASSGAVNLNWSLQTGSTAATSFTVQFRITGSSSWTNSISVNGSTYAYTSLTANISYDFSVIGTNSAGSGPASASVTAIPLVASQSVVSITWNSWPSGTFTHGSGSIGVNAHVNPGGASPIEFGFSTSNSIRPTSWTAAILVNTDLWGVYMATPATAGSWYTWAQGLDGSGATVSPGPFVVQ